MLEGKLVLPKKQAFLEAGYTGVATKFGGLLIPGVTRKDIGRVFNREKPLGKVIDPFTFEVSDELHMPYDETVVLAVKDWRPFTHIEPGGSDVAFGVSDWSKKSIITRSEKEGAIID
jgi:hypothetical protein